MKTTLQHIGNGFVRLPNGNAVLAVYATSLGYTVEGLPPKPAPQVATPVRRPVAGRNDPAPVLSPSTPSAVQAARDERFDAVLSLPEAAGRYSAAREVAASSMPLAEAGRFLASLPEDAPPAPAETPIAASPADPKAARLAEIRTMNLPRRGRRQ